jgi:transcriptional regulator with XRE-family HTH domain
MPDAQLTEFGAHLRRAREARGVTLRRIADVTKISVRALEAVERNDFSRLPGGIFTRSFVRAYAIEAGLDPDETVRQFLAQCPNKDVAAVPVNSPECIDGPRRPSWLDAARRPSRARARARRAAPRHRGGASGCAGRSGAAARRPTAASLPVGPLRGHPRRLPAPTCQRLTRSMDPGVRSPLIDFFRRGEVARDVRLFAARGALAPRALEQLALLLILHDDGDPEVATGRSRHPRRAAPEGAVARFLGRSDVPGEMRAWFEARGITPGPAVAVDDDPLVEVDEQDAAGGRPRRTPARASRASPAWA